MKPEKTLSETLKKPEPQRNPKETLNETLNETPNETPSEALNKTLNETLHETLNDTLNESLKNPQETHVNVWSTKMQQIPCKWEVEMPKYDKYHAKWKAYMAKCIKYHAKCKVTIPKCSKYHAKRQVLVPNCCKYKANGTGKESQKKIQNLRQKQKNKNFSTLRTQIIGKTQCFAAFLPFRAPGSSFFSLFLFLIFFFLLLSSLALPISAFHVSILSEVWLLNLLRLYKYSSLICVFLSLCAFSGGCQEHKRLLKLQEEQRVQRCAPAISAWPHGTV